jgi:hypothetical protein
MPESKIVPADTEEKLFVYVRDSFDSAGVDNYNNPPSQHPDMFEVLENVQPITTGNIGRRWGSTSLATAGNFVRNIAEYQNDSTGERRLITTQPSEVLQCHEDGSALTGLFTPSGGALTPRVAVSRDWAYIFDGVLADNKKWNSVTGLQTTGIAAPTTAVTIGALAAGSVTLLQGRKYYGAFKNSTTGHVSDLNPVSVTTGPVAAQNIPLTWAETTTDTQVDRRLWLATADGGNEETLYLLADTAIATTTLTDNITDDVLILGSTYLEVDDFGEQHGIADNSPPPMGTFPTKHKGRIWVVNGQNLYFSKNQDEVTNSQGLITSRYEESWPADYVLDIAEGTETVRGLLSDGDVLYVGTERHVRKISGTGPSDLTVPEIAFNNVGVLNQDVWKIVYSEGAPVGSIWLTPDFRLIASDFNVYRNVGEPVQTTLNSINRSAASKCHAMFGSEGAYDLYILAVPTGVNTECDTLIVYQLSTKKFFIWKLPEVTYSMHFNVKADGTPQWLFTSATSLLQFDKTVRQDHGISFTVTVRTSWLNLGDSSTRKVLNELEFLGDPNVAITVEGATTDAEFLAPQTVVSGSTVTTGPLGQLKLYLAGKTSKSKFYRFSYVMGSNNSSNSGDIDGYSAEAFAIHRL